MTLHKTLATIATTALVAAALANPVIAEEKRTKLGVLECEVEGGMGLLLGSSKGVTCSFQHANGTVETYTGTSSKIGIDIGVTGKMYLSWLVFTPIGNKAGKHALAGQYVGISAAGALGIGLGANALVGGSNKKIGLQPLSVEAGTGVNIALGVSSLTLEPAS